MAAVTQIAEPRLTDAAVPFEAVYQEAHGDATRIPWADGRPNPALINWLNAVAPTLIRCGARVAVVGCGLGDDARELIRRGYDVLAFDCAPSAVEWSRGLDPEHASSYVVADLFDLPDRWRHRFDLVVEVNTIQSLEPELHESAMMRISELLSTHGHLLVVCRGAEESPGIDDGPPWPLTTDGLESIASVAGLVPAAAIASFLDDEDPPVRRLRALLRRA